ncbi:MAG: thiamine-phosphate kinase [Candidatus Omnitrophica bacterium]|nr:thiamine-phosphate kinase [Candidatus Omnitrophota bacterium]
MRVDKLGEFGLIERFKRFIKLDSSVIQGAGDDCAVIKYTKDKYLLFTCDMLVEGVDFTSDENPYLIGRKSVAVSISDIAACAGLPKFCLVSLGLPKKTPVEFMDKFFKGTLDMLKRFKINLVGGDLSRAHKLTIDVSMLGVVEKRYLVLRKGAKVGDIIFVTGKLGGSIYGKHLRFVPRIKEARFLTKNFKIHSLIDISDGLAQDLGHILRESKCGAVIYEEAIPLDKAAKGIKDALYQGEDFELLFTLSRSEARRLWQKAKNKFIPIGEIIASKWGFRLIKKDGTRIMLKPKGFVHF